MAAMKGREVANVRESLGLTQSGLAQLLGVHVMTISRWERGAVRVPEPMARLILLETMEAKALKGVKQVRAFFDNQHGDPRLYKEAQIGSRAMSAWARERERQVSRLRQELRMRRALAR